MTATCRPELVDQTLRSFRKGLLGSDPTHRLIVNIDPVPEAAPDGVCRVLKEYFGANTEIRRPASPSFPGALKWCWSQVTTEYFLNLEDDWELLVDLDLNDMLMVMDEHPWLATLRLPKGQTAETECVQSGSPREPRYLWNGRFFQCPAGRTGKNGYYGSPSLIRNYWAQQVWPLLQDHASPEKQLRRLKEAKNPAVWCWEHGVYSVPNTPAVIQDIGTQWRRDRGIRKNSKYHFTRWEV